MEQGGKISLGQREVKWVGEGMAPDDLLCSRNARPEKALVGRAQWKINQAPSLKRERASLEGPLGVVHAMIQEMQRRIRVVLV